MTKKYALLFCLCLIFASSNARAEWRETAEQKAQRLAWWTEARFGMFIHWGLYAQAARHEWVKNREQMTDAQYQKYFDTFNPDLYDPAAWAKTAKAAGMKYLVVTSKHHEGFCLWDSKYTDYKAPNTPYGKDLLKPMVEAFRAEGLKVGFYYSLLDWHHPDYTVDRHHPMRNNQDERAKNPQRDMKKYADYVYNQVEELLTTLSPDLMWLDFSFPGPDGKGRDDWQSERLIQMVREKMPNVIVNDRLDLLDTTYGWDFRTPEQNMPREWVAMNGQRVPWETCQTFSGSWGYYRDEETWKSPRQLVAMLIEVVSKGGNLLLNVGPTGRGTFDARAMARLDAMGQWMKLHSRSIYGCTQAPAELKAPANCFLTYNPELNRLYIHVMEWPFKSLHLYGYNGKVAYAQLLNDASEIRFTEHGRAGDEGGETRLTFDLPVKQPEVAVPVIEVFLKAD
ncbi:alpha-L-fucosidase [candidate division KSB1 bacterium]|nr:alpha-L-fucosidase [candidate division KSB1 bacterium]RQW04643.1 MAG: alpha-L-fucosidase [candidate division KSB1 bacterium]